MNGKPLHGLMMEMPLMISSIIDYAALWHGDSEVVSREPDGSVSRSNYREVRARAAQLALALQAYGIRPGDRVATMAWNSQRHLELYYAISGIGAIIHTINPRLFSEQIEYVVNHAADRLIFVDADLAHLLEPLAPRLTTVEGYVVLGDAANTATTLPNLNSYEEFIAPQARDIVWPQFDERTASGLCYTSGTTGNPKGALYSHRSTVLHALSGAATLRTPNGAMKCALPVVPMFHVNAWGLPYTAPLLGAKLVLPGPKLDPASLYELFEKEQVDFTAGVPTVWLWLVAYVKEHGLKFSSLRALGVGGSAAPRSMIETLENDYGISVQQGWGMTETSPVCTTGILNEKQDHSPQRLDYKARAGRIVYGVEMKLVDDDGKVLPDDGTAQGELLVRGHWVASGYYRNPEASEKALTSDGYFRTGDIASLDPDGYLTIRDRTKDVIKSGGEWISSIDLENVAVSHPQIAEAAAVGMPHPVWGERPVLIVKRAPGANLGRAEVLEFLKGKIVKWWMPDDVLFVDELPHTATGKISKLKLREEFKDYHLPAQAVAGAKS